MKKYISFILVVYVFITIGCKEKSIAFDGISYKTISTENGIKIIGYNGEKSDISIPELLNGKKVVSIGDFAFSYESEISRSDYGSRRISKISLPETIIDIGKYAFAHNNLSNIIIPNSVKDIGKCAFSDNPLLSIIIPDDLINNIGQYTDFLVLEDMTYKGYAIVKYTGEQNLYHEYTGINIFIPNHINNMDVVSISDKAFDSLRIYHLKLPNRIKKIGDYAFRNNRLENIILPNSLEIIGNGAFEYNQLKTISIGYNVTFLSDNLYNLGCNIQSRPIYREKIEFDDNGKPYMRTTNLILAYEVTKVEGKTLYQKYIENEKKAGAYTVNYTIKQKSGLGVSEPNLVPMPDINKQITENSSTDNLDKSDFEKNYNQKKAEKLLRERFLEENKNISDLEKALRRKKNNSNEQKENSSDEWVWHIDDLR